MVAENIFCIRQIVASQCGIETANRVFSFQRKIVDRDLSALQPIDVENDTGGKSICNLGPKIRVSTVGIINLGTTVRFKYS